MASWKYDPNKREITSREKKLQEELKEVKPEGFASRNVKTITFLLCVAFLLTVGFGIGIWVRYQDKKQPIGKEMTEQELVVLSKLGPALTMEKLCEYQGELNESEDRSFYYITFDHYLLFAVEDNDTKTLLSCTLKDKETGDQIEIMKEDVAAFLESH